MKTRRSKKKRGTKTQPSGLNRDPSANNNPGYWRRPGPRPVEKVSFEEVWNLTLSGASTSVVKRWNPNSLYSPEVGGAPASIPYFANFSPLYNAVRVLQYRYEAIFSNNEAFPVNVFVINSGVSVATSVTVRYATAPFCHSFYLSAKGGMDRKTISGVVNVSSLVGRGKEVDADDSYAGSFVAGPADPVWLALGATSSTVGNLTNGVSYQLKLTMNALLYEPKLGL